MSENLIYLIPTSSKVTVRDPRSGEPLPDDGAYKPRSSYWLRRLRDHDVKEGKPPRNTAPAAGPGATTAKSTAKGDSK